MARCRDVVERETRTLTREIAKLLPDFGEKIAVDATDVYVHSNPDRAAVPDPDAGWTAKTIERPRPSSKRRIVEKDWHFGYKYHAVVDATHGIPIAGFTTRANLNETITMPRLLEETLSDFSPRFVMADRGYDSQANHSVIIAKGAQPLIPMRAQRSKNEIEGDLHAPDGVLKCIGGERMTLVDSDEDKGRLYRCRADGCSLKSRKGVRYCDDVQWDKPEVSRRYPSIPRDSKQWKSLYPLRQSVERLFKSLKQSRRLNAHCQRGLARVALHCAMSVLAFQTTALNTIQTGRLDLLRWQVEPVS